MVFSLSDRLVSFCDAPRLQAISSCTRSVCSDKHPPVACMPDAAGYEADVIVDGQQRVLWRGTPRRLQAGDVLRLAGVVYLVPLGTVSSINLCLRIKSN
jgi:hypothetical protein